MRWQQHELTIDAGVLDLVPRGIEVNKLRDELKLRNGTLRNEHKLRSDSSAMSSKLLHTCNYPVPLMACRVGEEGVGCWM